MARNSKHKNSRGARNKTHWFNIDQREDAKNNRFAIESFDPDQNERISRKVRNVTVSPRGSNQKKYVQYLQNPETFITFGIGPAGSGKTMLATQVAIKMLVDKKIEKIVITRPAVSVDEQHGFLPGTLEKKLEPWLLPILDIFAETYSQAEIKKMLNEKTIAIEPLAFMRGRTFKNSFIIADEMQNSTPSQMKMLLTRIGEGSQMAVTGDLNQHDRTFEANGLLDFIKKVEQQHTNGIEIARFSNRDIQRHSIIESVLGLYNEATLLDA